MDEAVPVICGPTAAGKSALALRIAERAAVTIISADSRQIYRGFDIGTAKPTAGEQRAVPHRGIDLVDPHERFSAHAWADAAAGWIADARTQGQVPLVVGGTGFYLRALFEPLFEEPELPPERRRGLASWLEHLPTAELRRWCEALDPARAHLGRTQLLRAIEITLLAGRRLSDLHRTAARAARFRARYLVVDPGAALGPAIASRVEAMIRQGWEDEVRRLATGVDPAAPAWNATGYRTMRALVAGEIRREAAMERIVIDTRQYAKRQRTWFRHQLAGADVTRVNPRDPHLEEIVRRWWCGDATGPGEGRSA